MKLLFAAPDRDILTCYEELLRDMPAETVTAFDGTQVLTLLQETRFDAVILDRSIPRVDYRRIIRRLSGEAIPVIVLLDEAVSSRVLHGDALPSAYLSYPFTSEELKDRLRDIIARASDGRRFSMADTEVDGAAFLCGRERITLDELRILEALAGDAPAPQGRVEVYIGALNDKLLRQSSRARIRYRAGEGYELVTTDE